MLGSKKVLLFAQRIELPEGATHVASVGDRSAVNFMFKLSCFYFCKWLLSIQDIDIRQCTVPACSTVFNRQSSRDADNSKGTGWFVVQQCSVTELNGTSGNAFHFIGRIYVTMLYHRATCLHRKCFSLYWQYQYTNALPPIYLTQPEMLLTLLTVLTLILLTWKIRWAPNNASKWHMRFNSAFKGLIYQCSTTDLFDSTGNASHSTDSINP
jgi:hypothetical protein